ncbi:hypothetical protein ABB22_15630 [Stenotrophomonas nitritireducens]|uniref:Transmembrane protein n=2 Tax=Stenotrophomonas nitritireducens TaxID=83617 RepID=A0ABR5NGF2_9GAMM|nr:hypothetical protein ABB22_15630 [Stenotrophomonas nitritireducens]
MIACLPFLPGLSGGFLFDDKPNIVQNFGVQIAGIDHYSLWAAAKSFPGGPGLRPLSMLSFALDFWLFGLDPVAFKLTNLLVHAITCIALTGLVRRLLLLANCSQRDARLYAFGLAVAWGTHALQVSSVLYVVQRMQTMSTLFVVLAMSAYVQARQAQIDGAAQHKFWLRVLLFWGLALACKEDAVLLPGFTLLIELTLLHFRAKVTPVGAMLQRGYLLLVVAGVSFFLGIVLPHFWVESSYPGRDFNTLERLLTQGRVLAVYVRQVVWPAPDGLPFYYDNLLPSRGLLDPVSTTWSIVLHFGLILWALLWRRVRPLFALGILLFYAGHSITSNVVGLELAFEHRNHFPLFGLLLAIGDLLHAFMERLSLRPWIAVAVCLLILAGNAAATGMRAYIWGNPLRLALHGTVVAPESIRAWSALCRANYDLSQGRPESPYFQAAIKACAEGGRLPGAATMLANMVILKTLNGTVNQSDWNALIVALQSVAMNVENSSIAINLVRNALRNPDFDEGNVLRVVAIVSGRKELPAEDFLEFGHYALMSKSRDNLAYVYLFKGLRSDSVASERKVRILEEVRRLGHSGMAHRLEVELKLDRRRQ